MVEKAPEAVRGPARRPFLLQGGPGALVAQTVPGVVGRTEEKTLLWGPETKTASEPLSILKIIMSSDFPSMCLLVFQSDGNQLLQHRQPSSPWLPGALEAEPWYN